jgi:hypothetical protein
MFLPTSGHPAKNTIDHLVFESSRAHVLQSQGDGFGSYIERLMNIAHETHRSFPNILPTLNDLIDHFQNELERTYSQYQFSIILGKDFDFDENFSNHFALVEHTGMKILIFSSIGTTYHRTTTMTNNLDDDDDNKLLSW